MVTMRHVTHLMGRGSVEIESKELGSGMMLPKFSVNPVSVSGIFSFYGLRVLLAAALLLIISRGRLPG